MPRRVPAARFAAVANANAGKQAALLQGAGTLRQAAQQLCAAPRCQILTQK